MNQKAIVTCLSMATLKDPLTLLCISEDDSKKEAADEAPLEGDEDEVDDGTANGDEEDEDDEDDDGGEDEEEGDDEDEDYDG